MGYIRRKRACSPFDRYLPVQSHHLGARCTVATLSLFANHSVALLPRRHRCICSGYIYGNVARQLTFKGKGTDGYWGAGLSAARGCGCIWARGEGCARVQLRSHGGP